MMAELLLICVYESYRNSAKCPSILARSSILVESCNVCSPWGEELLVLLCPLPAAVTEAVCKTWAVFALQKQP